MPLDPQIAALLTQRAAIGAPDIDHLSLLEARSLARDRVDIRRDPTGLAEVKDLLVPGQVGLLPARLYRPVLTSTKTVLVFFHGGGWVVGDIDTMDVVCRELAVDCGSQILSVGYRLAPETPFPGALEDCYRATDWVTANAGDFGASSVSVGGHSAGANLAAAVCLMARDRNGPRLQHQVLICPPLAHATDSPYASHRENGTGYSLTSAAMSWFWSHYLGDPNHADHPYAAPLSCSDLSGLPPATIVTAEFDPLRDEGIAYARALSSFQVDVRQIECDGMTHDFIQAIATVDRAAEFLKVIAKAIRVRLCDNSLGEPS